MGDHSQTATQPTTATDQPAITLEDLTLLIESVRDGGGAAALPALDRLIQENPEAAQLIAELPTVIEDAGFEDGDRYTAGRAATIARQLDQLVEADPESWGDAVHILPAIDLGDGEAEYGHLLRMCEARIRRGAGDPERLIQVRGKLERGFLAQQRRRYELEPIDVAA